MPADGSPVTVASFEWLAEANLARCRLDASGIACHLTNLYMSSMYWHYVKALGGIRLQVAAEDAEDARVILNELPQEPDEPILAAGEKNSDRVLRAAVFGAAAVR